VDPFIVAVAAFINVVLPKWIALALPLFSLTL
jgi:hypothetical protein